MAVSLPTVFLLGIVIGGLLSAFLFMVRKASPESGELTWWAVAYLGVVASMALFAIRDYAPFLSILGGSAFALLGTAIAWNGTRIFAGRRPHWPGLFAGGLIWVAIIAFAEATVRVACFSSMRAVYSFLIARELARYHEEGEQLIACRPTAGLTAAHGVFGLAAAAYALWVGIDDRVYDAPVVKLMAIEGLAYAILLGFAMLTMSKERAAVHHAREAMRDALTGLANLRAFNEEASRVMSSASRFKNNHALLAFDLDHFKQVNDRLGHLAGDQALTIFAGVATRNIRQGDILARLGGEEFVILLKEVNVDTALAIAERIRSAFAEEAASLGEGGVTVSVGVVIAERPCPLAQLRRQADEALYRAKALGRNRVCLAATEIQSSPLAAIPDASVA